MTVKTTEVNRWEVMLEGDATTTYLAVNSVDGDDKHVKVRIGTTERIVSVGDWAAFASAVSGKIRVTAVR